jgi:hypothetical protein
MPEGAGPDLHFRTRLYSYFQPVDPTLTGYQGLAWRSSDNAIWVDMDNDHVLTDDEKLLPYDVSHDVGWIGTDNPDTAVNERQPFTTYVRQLTDKYTGVNINTLDEAHGTHVAGITAAHGILGGAMDGQAPGAEVVSMRACTHRGCSSAALTDGMVDLATNYDVDVINLSIGSAPAFNDGQSAMALLYDRLIDETGVQIVSSAGNSGAGTNTVGDPSSGDTVLSIGADITKETWLANYGSVVRTPRSVMPFSSRGPREDGGFKPDVTAPGAAIAPVPNWLEGGAVAETGYPLPPGYAMLQGTSMASPQATGAVALLLSAARQSHVDVSPQAIRAAVTGSADYNAAEPAIAQGHGRVDVPAAWKALAKGAGDAQAVSVSAPVCTSLSDQLVTPLSGPGLANRCAPGQGGQSVGESRSYDVTLTRTGGPAGAQQYQLSLVGNDGTFTVDKHVALVRDVPTTVRVTARPRTQGTHSAVLQVDTRQTRALDQSALLTVDASPVLDSTPWSVSGSVDRNATTVYTVAVPEGASALTVDLSGFAPGSQVRWWAFTPDGVSGERSVAGTGYCYTNYLDGNGCAPTSRTYTSPQAGVWELVVEARRTSPLLQNPFHLEASVATP